MKRLEKYTLKNVLFSDRVCAVAPPRFYSSVILPTYEKRTRMCNSKRLMLMRSYSSFYGVRYSTSDNFVIKVWFTLHGILEVMVIE
jgi:hypothetical protein